MATVTVKASTEYNVIIEEGLLGKIGSLAREEIIRLIDYLAGAIYVLGGEMIKTNRTTIVVAPAGVDISGFGMEDAETEDDSDSEPATSYIRESL